jgi:hypothetical protein
MLCYIHEQKEAVGACVGCGKFICSECCTEIGGKNYCKSCVEKLVANKEQEIDKLENKSAANQNQPMVFMNAGGGGAASAASSSSGPGRPGYAPPFPRNSVGMHILLFFFTAGIGNIIYYFYIKSKQNQWYAMYR